VRARSIAAHSRASAGPARQGPWIALVRPVARGCARPYSGAVPHAIPRASSSMSTPPSSLSPNRRSSRTSLRSPASRPSRACCAVVRDDRNGLRRGRARDRRTLDRLRGGRRDRVRPGPGGELPSRRRCAARYAPATARSTSTTRAATPSMQAPYARIYGSGATSPCRSGC